jgi:sodium-dependent phosphate cotransporter
MSHQTRTVSSPGWKKIGWGLLAVALFIASIRLMKEGAGGLAHLVQGQLRINNYFDSFGFGWLMAYLVLSGSPVAAAALALLAGDTISLGQTFTMLAGSRLGASFVVLLLGFVYVLRGNDRSSSLTTGVLCFLLTGSIQLVGLPIGMWLLRQGWLANVSWPALSHVAAVVDSSTAPFLNPVLDSWPDWTLFAGSLALINVSFRLFDRAVPDFSLAGTDVGQIHRLVYRPLVMFVLGLILTLVTTSVSVSIGILVPLSTRGFIRRENLIPYILGANLSTLVDTLVAGVLMGDPRAVLIVFAHMAAGAVISVPLVLLAYRPFERTMSDALTWVLESNVHLGVFLAAVFFVPVLLVLM